MFTIFEFFKIQNKNDIDLKKFPILSNDYIKPIWNKIINLYLKKFKIDLSYMTYKLSIIPLNTNGEPTTFITSEKFGGCWTKNKIIYINPEFRKAFYYYSSNKSTLTKEQFQNSLNQVIAHELAHEICEDKKHIIFFKNKLKEAKDKNFISPYLKSINKNYKNYEKELFCEYISFNLLKTME